MTVNEVTAAGLITQTLDEIITDLETAFKAIYGSDINLDQNSPDGQMIGIFAQLKKDLLDLITDVYNSFDPEAALGTVLDQRVALNGLQRNGGTYTITPVSVTVDRALALIGLDTVGTPFTVQDTSGTQFYLEESQSPAGAGTYVYNFRAANLGAVQTQLNTITTQTTVVLGVTAVNNPSAAGTLGVDEEFDADLKLRRQISLAIAATNSLDAMRSNLANIATVTDVYVWENFTGSADVYSVPGHCMWAIVEGGADQDIADVIYAKRSAGCDMYGGESQGVIMPNGDTFTVAFDRPVYTDLYIKFNLTPKKVGATYVDADVKAGIVAGLEYHLFDTANSADITDLLATVVPLQIPSGMLISDDNVNWFEIVDSLDPQHKFSISASNITITLVP